MTIFSSSILGVSLVVLLVLLGYTLLLLRSGQLSPHLAVKWVLTELLIILSVLLWGKLPLFVFTSQIEDRAMMVMLAVLFFVFVVYLILDCLIQISTHTNQIKKLTQEIALLRAELQKKSG